MEIRHRANGLHLGLIYTSIPGPGYLLTLLLSQLSEQTQGDLWVSHMCICRYGLTDDSLSVAGLCGSALTAWGTLQGRDRNDY